MRQVEVGVYLLKELQAWMEIAKETGPNSLVFPTAPGQKRDKDNVRQRFLNPVRERASKLLVERGQDPLPAHFGIRAGRRTAVTYWCEANEDPAWVMDQVGHEDVSLTLSIYRQRRHFRRKDERIVDLMRRPDEASSA